MIVGAGAAGIRCAHKLWRRRGWRSTIYEWDDHPGGRIAALRGFFAGGQIAEMHGEFISSEHSAMLSLASRFSLGLDDTDAYPPGTNDTYWFNGRRYTQAQLNSDWQHTYYPVFHHAVKAVPWPQTYRRSNPTGRKWDAMSVPQWMSAHLPGGTGTRFGGLCLQDVLDEYGGDPGDQLLAVARNSDGSLTGTFSNGSSCKQVTADRFVFALPFSTLRRVDLSRAGLSRLKMTAIRRLGYGTNSKIIVQTTGRPWIAGGYTGNFYADSGANSGWELNYQVSNYSSPTALLLAFPAGSTASRLPAKYGLNFGTDEAPAPARLASDYLGYLDKILPGVTSAYNGRAYYKASTPSSPATRGWPRATRISAASTPRRTPRDTWRVRSPAARGWLASSDEQG